MSAATRRWPSILLTILALPIVFQAFAYVIVGKALYPPPLAASFIARPWGINPHAFFGGTGLLLGALQFLPAIRRRIRLHRILGRIYVVACLVTGTAGVYMAAYSYGGWITHVGFALLGIFLLIATTKAFLVIRRGDVESHKRWMIRSYALMFAAVMLRLELPFMIFALSMEFRDAYLIVAWLCWVPNLLVAELINGGLRMRGTAPQQLHYPSP